MKECKKSVGKLANFDMFIRLKTGGKVDSIFIHPELRLPFAYATPC